MSEPQTTAAQQGEHGEEHVGHLVPVKVLAALLAALLFLTVVTVAVSYFDLGPFNLAVAMVIAVIKASLVALFFMHLWWDKPFNAVLFVSALLFLGLFVIFCLMDSMEYQDKIDPNFGRDQMPQFVTETSG